MRGSRNFCQGGGGGGGGGSLTARKQLGQRFFFLFSFSPQLILQFTEGIQWFYYRVNYIVYFSKDRGGPTFLGGGSRVQVSISIETHNL